MRWVANRDVLPMRRASLCTAAFGMLGLLVVAPAAAQDMMQHVDLTSPEMTAAEMTRAEVEAAARLGPVLAWAAVGAASATAASIAAPAIVIRVRIAAPLVLPELRCSGSHS